MAIGNHPDHAVWKSMRARCRNKNNKSYKDYGGKGLTICPSWDDFNVFISDMGLRPSKKHSIDRIDGKLGYFKSNCRWATPLEQTQNRATKYACRRGHPWTDESTAWVKVSIYKTRRCKICLSNRPSLRRKSDASTAGNRK